MNNPKISIIIPTYNHAQELPKCLDSVFAQTILPPLTPPCKGGESIEVIVVNDGSTDRTEDVLRGYCKDKTLPRLYGGELKIITQPNQGAPVARNNGFKISRGEYLLFCDADALLRKDALEKMVGVLELKKGRFKAQGILHGKPHPYPPIKGEGTMQIGFVYPNHKFGRKAFRIFPFDEKKLKENNYIHTMALIKREAFPKEGFDPNLKKFQDWDLWLAMLENGYKGVWLDEFLFTCRPRDKKTKGKFLPKSSWLPSFMHKIPWKKFGIKIKVIEDYEYWRDVVLRKHRLL
ncbi:MAG: glycosyltransferase family 2 protein [bacterium]